MTTETLVDLLARHALIEKALPEAVKLVAELDQDPWALEATWSREIDEFEFYLLRVGHALGQLLNTYRDLHHTVLYLSSFSPTTRQKKNGITRPSHIQYHAESFMIRTHSLYDRVLSVVEAVFHLGIDPETLNHALIVSNVHVKHTAVPERLKALRKVVNRYREPRNAVVHRESYTDASLRRLQILYLPGVEESLAQGELGWPEIFSNVRRIRVRVTVRERIKEFSQFVDTAFERLKELLDELDVVYEERRRRLVRDTNRNSQ